MSFTLAVALLPVTGIMRFDLWGGRHVVGGHEVGFVEAAKAFAFPFLAINVVIVLASRFIGRYLCGFVCPVGALARLDDWLRWSERKAHHRWIARAGLFAASFGLAAVAFSFWVDWRVFSEGSGAARAVAGSALGLTGLAVFGTVHGLGLKFCRNLCPSGIYFAVLGPETSNGIEFSHPENCTECHACESACPMDLEPRYLSASTQNDGRGLYPEGLSNHALCIRCGDCVAACESTTAVDPVPTPLRMGWLREEVHET